ncbi:MAG: hypothetical protein R3C02_17665 [Planctomycetaceae bacterium]
MKEGLKIVVLSVLAAVSYGIVHDNVTTRICVEYFTVFHPRIAWVGESPTALATYWGVVATWWMGLGLGVPLACFARWGKPPKVSARQLLKPIGLTLTVMGISSIIMGATAYRLATTDRIKLFEPWSSRIPAEIHADFLTDLWAHNTAYVIGCIGGVCLWGWTVRLRNRSDSD